MIGYILTGHGQFAPGVASAVKMAAGDHQRFDVVPFDEEQAATYPDDLRAAIQAMRDRTDGVLVFVDLLGGTPFNQAMLISHDVVDVEVVTGANLPMLIELVLAGDGLTLSEAVEQALSVGRQGIGHMSISDASGAADDVGDWPDDEDGI